ncbi:MAG: imidazole glycerol phosphate synthase subunit HisH [Alphaproteobacteria bacterium]
MAKDFIVIIDYGSGNLRSAAKAFEHAALAQGLNVTVKISARPEDIRTASRIVLPGQGAFGDCMCGLEAIPGMRGALEEAVIHKAAPFLGICVGMQLMATRGLEHGIHAGLGWIPGEVVRMEPVDDSLKIPHMGWNELIIPEPGDQDNRHFVLRSKSSAPPGSPHYYFVHSFVFKCSYDHHVLAWAEYGGPVASIVGRDNMIGVQFHPEKSQEDGLRLIGQFLKWKP